MIASTLASSLNDSTRAAWHTQGAKMLWMSAQHEAFGLGLGSWSEW